MTDNERDTHFQNAGKLLADAIDLISEEWFITPGKDSEKLIAQFAYDLVSHTIWYDANEITIYPEDIPDLTQWPESPSSE